MISRAATLPPRKAHPDGALVVRRPGGDRKGGRGRLRTGDRACGSRGALAAGEQPREAGEPGGELHLVARAVEGRRKVGRAERQAGEGDAVVDLERLRPDPRVRAPQDGEGEEARRAGFAGASSGFTGWHQACQVRIRRNRDAVTLKNRAAPARAFLTRRCLLPYRLAPSRDFRCPAGAGSALQANPRDFEPRPRLIG